MHFFFGNNDNDMTGTGLETFIKDDGSLHIGNRIGNDFGIDIETGNTYMKIGDNFGIDI